MSLSWRCECAAGRGARPPSGSPRSSRRSWCSPSHPGTRSRTPRRAPACVWRCSSGWQWLNAGGCPLWVSALDTDHTTRTTERHSQSAPVATSHSPISYPCASHPPKALFHQAAALILTSSKSTNIFPTWLLCTKSEGLIDTAGRQWQPAHGEAPFSSTPKPPRPVPRNTEPQMQTTPWSCTGPDQSPTNHQPITANEQPHRTSAGRFPCSSWWFVTIQPGKKDGRRGRDSHHEGVLSLE